MFKVKNKSTRTMPMTIVEHDKKVSNIFKVNNKNTRTTS